MNTTHLKYAVEVEKVGSISKAAANLHMNQPQLSKAIRDLENSIGGPIFKRTSKGIVTTSKGEEFMMHARNILERTAALENLYKAADADEFRFNFSVPRASYIADAFYNFMQSVRSRRKIDGTYNETGAVNALSNITVGECDIGIIRYNERYEQYFLRYAEEKDLETKTLYKFTCNLLVSKDNPLAKEDVITAEMLKGDFAKVLYGDLSVPLLPVSKMADLLAKKEEKKHIWVYDRQSQYEILSRFNKSYSFTSHVSPKELDRFSLVEKKCDIEGITCKDVLVYRRNYDFTEIDKSFISFIKKEIEKNEENIGGDFLWLMK